MVIPARAPISRVLQFQHGYLTLAWAGSRASHSCWYQAAILWKGFPHYCLFTWNWNAKKLHLCFKILMVHWCLNWGTLPISRSCLGESRSNITSLYFVSWFKQTTDKLQTEGLFTWLPLSSAPTPVPAVNSSLSLWVLWPRTYIQ